MKSRLLGLLAATALSVVTGQTLHAQEILLGNLFAPPQRGEYARSPFVQLP